MISLLGTDLVLLSPGERGPLALVSGITHGVGADAEIHMA
jgi:hypothetical protein